MIRAKLVLRNLIGKPLRTAIIIISLAAAAFAALFSISGINASKNALRDFFSGTYGDMDLLIGSPRMGIDVKESDFPQGSKVVYETVSAVKLTIPSGFANYVNETSISVIGLDTQTAYECHMLDTLIDISQDGVAVTRPLAEQFGKKVGDTMTFYGENEIEYNLKIDQIVEATRFLSHLQMAIITSPEKCNEIGGREPDNFQTMYADVPEAQVAETIASLQEKYPDHYILGTTSMDSEDTMDSMFSIYILIFAVVFLMVGFIVLSMSKHIVNERMSVIGMLRSIGGSIKSTSMILLSESVCYGLFGGVLGTLLFLIARAGGGMDLFGPTIDIIEERSDGINPLTILLVILAVIAVQCLCSLAAILKASKTPVRDIIFGTKDTAYIPSVNLSLVGAILLAVGVLICLSIDDFMMTLLAAFCSVVGSVLLFPMVIKWLSAALAALFAKLKMPVARLAVKEIASTKSSISAAQLIVSAISLTITVLVIATGIMEYMAADTYHTELIITNPSMEGQHYAFLEKNVEGIQGVESVYRKYMIYEEKCLLNGEEQEIVLLGLNDGGFRYVSGIRDCPDSLADDETAIDKVFASKHSIRVGDEVTFTFKLSNYLPAEKKLRVKCIIDSGALNTLANTVMVSESTYKSVYYDEPSMVLIKTEPAKTGEVLRILRATLADQPVDIKLMEEYRAEEASSMSGIMSIIYAVILLGMTLSLLGTSSNLLMGFEQSRRKYAVYYSSSMSKSSLKRLILLETVLTCGISVVVSMVLSLYFLRIVDKALVMLYMSVPFNNPVLYAVLFGILCFVLLTSAAIRPMRMLSKMNIAEEIKTSAD